MQMIFSALSGSSSQIPVTPVGGNCALSPNSQKGPQNHNENGDPGSPKFYDRAALHNQKFT